MAEIYGEQHRVMQDRFDTEKLADRVNDIIVTAELDDARKVFIESRDLFFLTTIDLPPVLTKAAILALLRCWIARR